MEEFFRNNPPPKHITPISSYSDSLKDFIQTKSFTPHKKRCPKGYRKNKVTQRCRKHHNVPSQRRRCPKGFRRNKSTKQCNKKNQ
jgi:hypothetical protein